MTDSEIGESIADIGSAPQLALIDCGRYGESDYQRTLDRVRAISEGRVVINRFAGTTQAECDAFRGLTIAERIATVQFRPAADIPDMRGTWPLPPAEDRGQAAMDRKKHIEESRFGLDKISVPRDPDAGNY